MCLSNLKDLVIEKLGSHHLQGAILVPDDKLDCFVLVYFFAFNKNGLALYPGPVLPPWTGGSPIMISN